MIVAARFPFRTDQPVLWSRRSGPAQGPLRTTTRDAIVTITESTRHQLHQALIASLGEQEAATLMEHLPPIGWADVATKADIDGHRAETRADFEQLRLTTKADTDRLSENLEHLRAEMNSGFRAAQAAMDTRTETLRAEMAVGFALYPTQMGDLMAVADSNQIMPPKSTWFEPKLADGMVSHVLD